MYKYKIKMKSNTLLIVTFFEFLYAWADLISFSMNALKILVCQEKIPLKASLFKMIFQWNWIRDDFLDN